MCRMVFGDSKFLSASKGFDVNEYEELFAYLEGEAGGEGNGVALLGPKPDILKAYKMKARELAEAVEEHRGPFMFHTRKASIGPLCDDLCQPFMVKSNSKPSTIMMHNGTWGDYKDYIPLLLQTGAMEKIPLYISDSYIAARCASAWGPGFLVNMIERGVWINASLRPQTHVLGIINQGDWVYSPEYRLFASELPKGDLRTGAREFGSKTIIQMWPEYRLLKGTEKDYVVGKGYTPPSYTRGNDTRSTSGPIGFAVGSQGDSRYWENTIEATRDKLLRIYDARVERSCQVGGQQGA